MSRLVVAGASGFIGTRLVEAALEQGFSVVRLVRTDGAAAFAPIPDNEAAPSVVDVGWDPSSGRLEESVLAGADAVVVLNGAAILPNRWSAKRRELLRESRVAPVRTVVDAIGRLPESDRPKALLTGSAVGFYGTGRGDAYLTETVPKGAGFLAEVCGEWEAEARRADAMRVRTVQLRTGLVMGKGGMVGMLRPLFAAYLGVRLGDGKAWMPTISRDDHVRAILFLAGEERASGPVNMCGPTPVRNAEWTKALAKATNAKAFLAVPAFVVRAMFGDAADEAVLVSHRAIPAKLNSLGFEFTDPTIEDQLRGI